MSSAARVLRPTVVGRMLLAVGLTWWSMTMPRAADTTAFASLGPAGTGQLGTARYPYPVDPLLPPYANLGIASYPAAAIALSSDGSTALVGENGDVLVFVRSGANWIRQAQLIPPGGADGDAFGCSMALSANGDTALVGAPGRKASRNETAVPSSAWVFTRSGGTWTQQAVLRSGNASGSGEQLGCTTASFGNLDGYGGGFGASVALSGDGSLALIGAPGEDRYVGGVWAFRRTGAAWTPDGGKLLPAAVSRGALFGDSVAVSSDGDTAAVGAAGDIPAACAARGTHAGGVWVFTRVTGAWVPQGGRLAPHTYACELGLGASVALSSDGNTALVAGGGAWVFNRTGATWSQQGPQLWCGEPRCGYDFNLSVALSADGKEAVVGGSARDECGKYMYSLCAAHGRAWLFDRFATTWVRQAPTLEGSPGFGGGVSVSGAGDVAMIGDQRGAYASVVTPPAPNCFSTGPLTAGHDGVLDQQLSSSSGGVFTARATVSAKGLRLPRGSRHKLIDYGEGTASVSGPGTVNLHIEPTPRVRRALARHRSIEPQLRIAIRFRPSAGPAPAGVVVTAALERR